MRKFLMGVLFILLLGVCTIPTCSANPLSLSIVGMSGMHTSDPLLEMPSANVSIHITEYEYREFKVDIEGIYMLTASEIRNSSLAFVYPSAWGDMVFNDEENFTLTLDGESVSYILATSEDLAEFYDDDFPRLGLGDEALSFAQFNATLSPDTDHILEVETSFNQTANADYNTIQYYFGSASSFSGDTHEIISVAIELQVVPVSLAFSPDDYLTRTGVGLIVEAEWDFLVSQMGSDAISIAFGYYQPNNPQLQLLQVGLVGSMVIAIVAVVAYRRRRIQ